MSRDEIDCRVRVGKKWEDDFYEKKRLKRPKRRKKKEERKISGNGGKEKKTKNDEDEREFWSRGPETSVGDSLGPISKGTFSTTRYFFFRREQVAHIL